MGLPSCQVHLLGVSGRIHTRSLSPEGPFSGCPFPECTSRCWGHTAEPSSHWDVPEGMLGSVAGQRSVGLEAGSYIPCGSDAPLEQIQQGWEKRRRLQLLWKTFRFLSRKLNRNYHMTQQFDHEAEVKKKKKQKKDGNRYLMCPFSWQP